jgi:hypothetical protein
MMAIDPNPTRRDTNPVTGPADDRAQPGDVIGIEREGETTELGDTREDEDERRRDAEEAARNQRG